MFTSVFTPDSSAESAELSTPHKTKTMGMTTTSLYSSFLLQFLFCHQPTQTTKHPPTVSGKPATKRCCHGRINLL